MALRLRRDVQKASYYVWFLGAEEAKGLRGARVINSVLPYLVDRSRSQEPLKVTLQVSHKGVKIVQGSSKHLIPHSAITSSVQADDIVACVLLLYNPATKCPLHVHAYRCDSETTAEALHLQLQILINRPDNQKRFEELETRLGILPPALPGGGSQGHNGSGGSSHSGGGGEKRHESSHKTSHHQSQQLPHQQQLHLRRQETSPKRFSSSLGSDTGNSTRESECSEEHGLAGSPVCRSPPHGSSNSKHLAHGHPLGHVPLTAQQNSELFDSLAAELRAKLNGNGPPLLLPPRDYDTVHRSKGNLTAIELRRCRNALIVGGAGTPKNPTASLAGNGTAANGSTANGKQVSSRGSSGIGSDLAPSPDRHELNSSSDDEHWSNEADNSVIALKPSQIALSHHAQLQRKSAVQPPEDSYLRDLPAKPYVPRQSERTKTPVTASGKGWTREDEIKPIIMRPTDYDGKFNRVMQLEPQPAKHDGAAKLGDTDKYNEINRLLNKKLSGHDRDRERLRERELVKTRSLHDDELDDFEDSDPCSEKQLPAVGYRKENLTDKQKFMEYASKKQQLKSYASEEAQRYGGSRHRYVDPAELPFEQPPPVGHNKYAAVHRGAEPARNSTTSGGSICNSSSNNTDRRERHDRDRDRDRDRERERERERERDHEHSRDRNPYREAESLPYIQSMEKMMKSTGIRYGEEPPRKPSSRDGARRDVTDYGREYPVGSQMSPRERFHDAKHKFRAMERTSSNRYDLDERSSGHGGGGIPGTSEYRSSSRRRRDSIEQPSYEQWSDGEEDEELPPEPIVNRSRARSREHWEQDQLQQHGSSSSNMRHARDVERDRERDRERERERDRERDRDRRDYPIRRNDDIREPSHDGYRQERERECERARERERERERVRDSHSSQSRHQLRARSREYMQPVESVPAVKSSSSRLGHHAERYPSPAPTPNSGNSAASSGGGVKPLASMPKGYRHSYAEPVFARSGGRVGLAAVNPY